jgi:cytochrome bd ubiquinol oxidase subunit I
MVLDSVELARLQLAFTITFHIIFPAFTIGLSAYIATLLVIRRATGREHFRRLAPTGAASRSRSATWSRRRSPTRP